MKNIFGEAIRKLNKHSYIGNRITEKAYWDIQYAVGVLDECQKLLPFLKALEDFEEGVSTKPPQEEET